MVSAPCLIPAIEVDIESKLRAVRPDAPRLAPAGAELLKRTRSACPECLSVIDADVAIAEGEVRMYKICPEHGRVEAVVAPNVEFYRATMNHAPIRRMTPNTLIIPITHRCNLKCKLCFVPQRERDDLSFDDIRRIIDAFPGKMIGLSGGEPTLREDLFELIRYVRSTGRTAPMFTNAIKLADPEFVERLVEAGLQTVLFSFNGFSDKTYRSVHGRPLLDVKRMALQNCERAGLNVVLSPTIFRGLNEADIKPLLELCLEHKCISQLRIRGAARVGRHSVYAPLSTFEMFSLVAEALGRTVQDFCAELDRDRCYHSAIQFNLFAVFDQHKKMVGWNSGQWSIDRDLEACHADLEAQARKAAGGTLGSVMYLMRYRQLEINTWGWPDASNIDFQEIWSNELCHLYDNRVPMNFFEAVLRGLAVSSKVALITGSSSGIGMGAALTLAAAGFEVIATMRDTKKAGPLRAAAEQAGLHLSIRALDVRDQRSIDRSVAAVLKRKQRIDLLVNNAGVGFLGSVEQTSEADLERVMDTNFRGVWRMTKAVLPTMRAAGRGRIITISSICGLVAQPFSEAYCASKFAIEGMMESFAPLAQRLGIELVLIEPGPVHTEFLGTMVEASLPSVNALQPEYRPWFDKFSSAAEQAFLYNGQTLEPINQLVREAATASAPKFRYLSSELVRAVEREKRALDGGYRQWGLE